MGAPVKFFKAASLGKSLPSTLEGGALYFVPNKGIYSAQGDTAGVIYPGNEYYCYANYTVGNILARSSSYNPSEIKLGVVVYYKGASYASAEVKFIGIYVASSVTNGLIYSTPMLVYDDNTRSYVTAYYRTVGTQEQGYAPGWFDTYNTAISASGTTRLYSLTCE